PFLLQVRRRRILTNQESASFNLPEGLLSQWRPRKLIGRGANRQHRLPSLFPSQPTGASQELIERGLANSHTMRRGQTFGDVIADEDAHDDNIGLELPHVLLQDLAIFARPR